MHPKNMIGAVVLLAMIGIVAGFLFRFPGLYQPALDAGDKNYITVEDQFVTS